MKKIALIGASSSIGQKLYPFLCAQMPEGFSVIPTYFSKPLERGGLRLNITVKDDLRRFIDLHKPDAFIWLAGTKNIAKCQADYNFAHCLNTQPVLDLCQILQERQSNAHIVFISTDYVFDGTCGGYSEKSKAFPTTVYGETNLISENTLQSSLLNWTIVRTSAIVGKGYTYFDWLVNSLRSDNAIAAYADSIFTPTPITLFCKCVRQILLQPILRKILHVVGENAMSRYDFSVKVAQLLGKESLVSADSISETSSFFQRNLSLVASPLVKNQGISLEIFISDELCND